MVLQTRSVTWGLVLLVLLIAAPLGAQPPQSLPGQSPGAPLADAPPPPDPDEQPAATAPAAGVPLLPAPPVAGAAPPSADTGPIGPPLVRLTAPRSITTPPADDDFTAATLRRCAAEVVARYGGDYRRVPLEEKAEFFEWALWRYHLAPCAQVATIAALPDRPGVRPMLPPDSDTSTWNGTLLAALSWKYAVTHDPQTLQRINVLLDGLEFYTTVTGTPGFYSRSVVSWGMPIDASLAKFGAHIYTAADGTRYGWIGDPARGTYNQLAAGYASLMMYVYPYLPDAQQRRARKLADDLVMNVLDHDYHLTEPDGRRTSYGDLTPLVAGIGVPFNAQVAYLIVALGEQFPPADPGQKGSIDHQFHRLRAQHHAYWVHPLKGLILPQKVGASALVKGMNDRFHVTSAAYHSMVLEVDRARREGRDLDKTFLYRMGQTMIYSMRKIGGDHNALCNFMWAGLLSEPRRFEMIAEKSERGEAVALFNRGIVDGVEQLRRFPLDRFRAPGHSEETSQAQWIDAQRPDAFQWKADPNARFIPTGPPGNRHVAAIDYLAAYWLMRFYAIDRQPIVARQNAEVLGTTATASAAAGPRAQ